MGMVNNAVIMFLITMWQDIVVSRIFKIHRAPSLQRIVLYNEQEYMDESQVSYNRNLARPV